MKEYWKKKPEQYVKHKLLQQKIHHQLKFEVLVHYSGTNPPHCMCQGEDCWHKGLCPVHDSRALSIDHINGDGKIQRANVYRSGTALYRWLKTNNYPEDVQVLCMSCQFVKASVKKEIRASRNKSCLV
jgi:hypothetical protein